MYSNLFMSASRLLLACVVLSSSAAFGAHIEIGPMLGHVGSDEARIWVKSSHTARLSALVGTRADLSDARRIDGPVLDYSTDNNGHVRVHHLKPSTRYYYNILLDGEQGLSAPYPSFETAPQHGESTHLRFAFGSCVGHVGQLSAAAWGEMAGDKDIDLLLMLGDNHYADSTDPAVQRAAYYDHRSVAGFEDIVRRTAVYGIWDDHDYGPNNSDRTVEGRHKTLSTFKSMWANPSYGEPNNPGTYYRLSYGDIDSSC